MFGTVQSRGFNFIGQTDGSTGWLPNDYQGTSVNPLDPGLDPNGPAFNGGPTMTIKLLTNTTSGAWRNGDPTLAGAPDQRGWTRQVGDVTRVSIGAFDSDATAP